MGVHLFLFEWENTHYFFFLFENDLLEEHLEKNRSHEHYYMFCQTQKNTWIQYAKTSI